MSATLSAPGNGRPPQLIDLALQGGGSHGAFTWGVLDRLLEDDKKATLIPPGWFDMFADSAFATDPVGAKQNPPVLRAPNGVVQDNRTYWMSGKPLYQPSDITVPTMLIHAEWDADLPIYHTMAYFAELKNAPYKRWVELGEGTHFVMLEKNRIQFIHEVELFLEESPQALD